MLRGLFVIGGVATAMAQPFDPHQIKVTIDSAYVHAVCSRPECPNGSLMYLIHNDTPYRVKDIKVSCTAFDAGGKILATEPGKTFIDIPKLRFSGSRFPGGYALFFTKEPIDHYVCRIESFKRE